MKRGLEPHVTDTVRTGPAPIRIVRGERLAIAERIAGDIRAAWQRNGAMRAAAQEDVFAGIAVMLAGDVLQHVRADHRQTFINAFARDVAEQLAYLEKAART